MFLLMNIGCIECGCDSGVVGMFSDKAKAEALREECSNSLGWRGGGQNHYSVFEIPSAEFVSDEYLKEIADSKKEAGK